MNKLVTMNILTNKSSRLVRDFIRGLQSTSSTKPLEIKIPNRIERGPTDILKALERTISRKTLVPHYKYIDDPFLLPVSVGERRYRSLSLESGRKTAAWIYKEHADLFERELATPRIPDLLPPPSYSTKDEVSEEILLNAILNGQTCEALKIYDLLDQNVSIKAKQSLLELLCFSNSMDLDQFKFQEERWFKMVVQNNICVWNETEEIKNLSDFLMSQDQETSAAAYNALICGMAKYNEVHKAWSLYSKCIKEQIPLNVHAYNGIIRTIPFLYGLTQNADNIVFEKLSEMSTNGICPNINTLNAALETAYTIKSYEHAMDFIQNLLKDFKMIGIKPSLTTFSHILTFASEQSDSVTSLLTNILKILEQSTLPFVDVNDIYFFPLAMKLASKKGNHTIGERIHALYLKDDNYKFINNCHQEANYYSQYVLMKLATLPFEEFVKSYYELTKYTYVPEPNIMLKCLSSLKEQSNTIIVENLPNFWNQCETFSMLDTDRVLHMLLDVTCFCKLESESPLQNVFAKYALNIWNRNQLKNTKIRRYVWDATRLGQIVLILLRASWFDQASHILSFMLTKQAQIKNAISSQFFNELLELCILHGNGSIGLLIVKNAVNFNLENAILMARKLHNAIPLSTSEEKELNEMVGGDIMQLFNKD